MTDKVIATVSRQPDSKAREREAELQEAELQRSVKLAARSYGRGKTERVADLLAFLGVILNTPEAKHRWASQ